MPSAYGISSCLGWYRAGVGVYSDAGVTSANPGDTVQFYINAAEAANAQLDI